MAGRPSRSSLRYWFVVVAVLAGLSGLIRRTEGSRIGRVPRSLSSGSAIAIVTYLWLAALVVLVHASKPDDWAGQRGNPFPIWPDDRAGQRGARFLIWFASGLVVPIAILMIVGRIWPFIYPIPAQIRELVSGAAIPSMLMLQVLHAIIGIALFERRPLLVLAISLASISGTLVLCFFTLLPFID